VPAFINDKPEDVEFGETDLSHARIAGRQSFGASSACLLSRSNAWGIDAIERTVLPVSQKVMGALREIGQESATYCAAKDSA
jgi:hypothetical protein